MELCVGDGGCGGLELPEDGEGEAGAVVAQGAQVGAEELGHHVNALVDQVDCRRPSFGFLVDGCVGSF